MKNENLAERFRDEDENIAERIRVEDNKRMSEEKPYDFPCSCGPEFVLDHSEFGLPLGCNRSCFKCNKIWYEKEEYYERCH